MPRGNGSRAVAIAASLESELAVLPSGDEREAFLKELGLGEPGLSRIIRATHEMLGLVTFFTTGPKGHALVDRERRHGGPGRGNRPQRHGARLHLRRDHHPW